MAEEEAAGEAEAPHRPLLVMWSTEESVEHAVPSVLAGLEVALAVAAYWTIAIYFETFSHLWISICIAPLLLLRSDQSVALGARWFESYLNIEKPEKSRIAFSIALAATLAATFLMYYALSFVGGSDYAWEFTWRTVITFALAAAFGAACLFAILGPSYVDSIPGYLWFVLPSIFIWIWLRTVIIRFVATTVCLRSGFWEIPKNFYQTLFVVDVLRPAELVPGYKGAAPAVRSDLMFRAMRKEKNFLYNCFSFLMFVIFFVPAYVYRLGIKSTCWLYMPLVYIAGNHEFSFSLIHLIDRVRGSPWERLRRMFAVATFAGFAVVLLIHNFTRVPELLANKLVSPLEYFLLLDLPWKKPWQLFNLLSALITIYLWIEAGHVRIDQQHANEPRDQEMLSKRFEWLKFVMRLRNTSSAILVLILGVHVLLVFSPVMTYLPPYILRGLASVYGEYMPLRP